MSGFQHGKRTVTVLQGEFRICSDPDTVFSTILGSCVAACLFDAKAGVGGMNHFLLPGQENSGSNIKYGVNAMEMLINGLLKEGAVRENLRAKLFGAGAMSAKLANIGKANEAFARDYLTREEILCVSSSLGGISARKIRFVPVTGEASQLMLPPQAAPDLVEASPPSRPPDTTTEITLF